MTKQECLIYKITNPKGLIYIGQTRNLSKRLETYTYCMCHQQHKIYNSIKKYGWHTHTFEIIEYCEFEDMNKRERYWQDYYDVLDRNKGLNLTLTDTDELPRIMSEEAREKMRQSGKIKIFTDEHRANLGKVWRGRKHTDESRRKMSESQKGEKSHRYGKPAYNKGKLSPKTARGNNPNANLIMCEQTGIFYYCLEEAAELYGMTRYRLGHMLRGTTKNVTSLIYV